MHILALIALVLFLGVFFFVKWLLTIIGVLKPQYVVGSGVPIGGEARRRLRCDSPSARRHIDACENMKILTDDHNGESWRVLGYKPAIDNTYEFILLRTA